MIKIYAQDKSGAITEYLDLRTNQVPQQSIVRVLTPMIQKQHRKGSFLFVESFIYASDYLKQRPFIKDVISQRFQYAFLDEAQDCSTIQLDLLNELFGTNSKTIFQQIGDIHQSISETAWKTQEPCLYLKKSMRFGDNMTNFINYFIDSYTELQGNPEVTKKVLIIYNQTSKLNVLEKFADIIKQENIAETKNRGFFAVSYTHSQLKEYFPNYSEKIAKNKNKKKSYRFDADIEYIDLITDVSLKINGSQFISNILCSLLYKYYKVNGHAWSELRQLVTQGIKAEIFRDLIMSISKDVLLHKCVTELERIKKDLNIILDEEKVNFVRNPIARNEDQPTIVDNFYISLDRVKVKMGTIHSVKGQTHDATLFFSNKGDRKQDIQHTLDNTPQNTPKYKKLLYVAASRPKYLFALAIEKNAYDALTEKNYFNDFEKITI